MSNEKPWLEKWRYVIPDGADRSFVGRVEAFKPGEGPNSQFGSGYWSPSEWVSIASSYPRTHRMRLAAAAPQLARALALAEMADGYFVCPVCDGSFSDPNPSRVTKHFDCPLDAALTAAGLDTAEKREEARRWGT